MLHPMRQCKLEKKYINCVLLYSLTFENQQYLTYEARQLLFRCLANPKASLGIAFGPVHRSLKILFLKCMVCQGSSRVSQCLGFLIRSLIWVPYLGSLIEFLIQVPYSSSLFRFLIQVAYQGSLLGFLIWVIYLGSLSWFLFQVPYLGS